MIPRTNQEPNTIVKQACPNPERLSVGLFVFGQFLIQNHFLSIALKDRIWTVRRGILWRIL